MGVRKEKYLQKIRETMQNQIKSLSNLLIFTLLITTLLLTAVNDGFARRKYNPKITKIKALEMLRQSSPELARLAGIDPSLLEYNDEDGEGIEIDFNAGELSENETNLCETNSMSDESDELSNLELFKEIEIFNNDNSIDLDGFKTLWLAYVNDDDPEYTDGGFNKKEIMEAIVEWLGTPYRYGGNGDRGIDCSGFTRTIFAKVADGIIPRTANYQYGIGQKVNRSDLQFGDLVFFNTRRRVYISHVGIYLGDNIFAHASSRYGVTFSYMKDGNYYDKTFIGAKRVYLGDLDNIDDRQKDIRTISQR